MRKSIFVVLFLLASALTVSAQPAKPALVTPRQMDAVLVNSNPVFTWQPVSGAKRYVLKLYREQTLIVQRTVWLKACASGTCTVTLPALTTRGEYRWNVTAFDATGSAVSGMRTFGVYPQAAITMLRLVNMERCARGISPLALHPRLTKAAQRHSNDMAARNFVSHTGSDGTSPGLRMSQAGYNWQAWAENIAAGNSTAAATFNQWMASSGHRANLLSATYREMGLAFARNNASQYGMYWTQTLGKRNSTVLGVCP